MDKIAWYDAQPHIDDATLASTHPHHLISHRKHQFLSAITNNCKFSVTTPLFSAFFNFVQLSKLYAHPRF